MAKRKKKSSKKMRAAARAKQPHRGDVMLPPPFEGATSDALPARDTDLDLQAVTNSVAIEPPPGATMSVPPTLESGIVPRDTLTDARSGVGPVEHRSAPRVPVALEVDLHLASDSHFFTGLSGDISEGGLCVSTYRQLSIGSPVEVEFSLPSGEHVTARGSVRWEKNASPGSPPGFGIAFDELPANDRAIIQKFCSTRPPLYYDDVG